MTPKPVALFVKVSGATAPLWLDRLCHGLLSWWHATGTREVGDDLVLVVPESPLVARVYFWAGSGDFPWAKVPREDLETLQHAWAGDLSEREVKKGRERFPDLESWTPPPAPRLELNE
ncbi:MAG: hypothetical protein JST16_00255 [Bdellovibrionales bacterium]|nr:hypothetical protein [Bdellovibrionales bacterium]